MAADADLTDFGEFVRRRFNALYRYALVLTDSPHDADDLVQEALTRTGLAWRRVLRRDDPEGYVRTTMARIMANRWRRQWRERLVTHLPEDAVTDPDLVSDAAGFDALVAGLPPRMRAVLVLRYVDERTESEIAEILGCTKGTVKSQAARALAKLRAAAEPDGRHHG